MKLDVDGGGLFCTLGAGVLTSRRPGTRVVPAVTRIASSSPLDGW